MSRRKGVTTVFACQSCGAVAPKWLGRCPDCGEWNSYVEEVRGEPSEAPAVSGSAPISAVSVQSEPRISTAIAGLDRVLGGGIVPGSVVLFGGEPGIGKSTLLLQAARGIARVAGEVLYVSGEESASQVRLRGERIGIREERLLVLAETDVTRVIAECEARPPAVVVVDSIQAIHDSALSSAPGTVSQVRECAGALLAWAKRRTVPVLLIGHVTKDGSLAGPKSLEHLVDAVVTIEGERGSSRRIVRATKNRFGPVEELALYEMSGSGLDEIANPSAALLAERRAGIPGSAVTAAREGSRSLLVEIQALVGPSSSGSPRRVALGVDPGRLALLLAVLEGAGVALSTREVFASCAGGLEVEEPACDLAIVAALLSSVRSLPIPGGAVVFGEIGLLGEIRTVPAGASRLREAAALGFTLAFLPAGNAADAVGFPEIDARPVSRVADFVREIWGRG
ncbi:MAG: DNA repair protein RadA [Acidobacteriota bacterium]|nr:DNA repair protein RadA [Acidobacteriota bacterium]